MCTSIFRLSHTCQWVPVGWRHRLCKSCSWSQSDSQWDRARLLQIFSKDFWDDKDYKESVRESRLAGQPQWRWALCVWFSILIYRIGFFGETISCTVAEFFAEVSLTPETTSTDITFKQHPQLDSTHFNSLKHAHDWLAKVGYHGGLRLLLPTAKRFYQLATSVS